jgi:hypothetical protein
MAAREGRGSTAADEDQAGGPEAAKGGEPVTKEVTGGAAAGKGKGKAEDEAEPFAYVALSDLYINGDGAGVMPVCAHRAGAMVLPQDVQRFGWADQVRRADRPAPADNGEE